MGTGSIFKYFLWPQIYGIELFPVFSPGASQDFIFKAFWRDGACFVSAAWSHAFCQLMTDYVQLWFNRLDAEWTLPSPSTHCFLVLLLPAPSSPPSDSCQLDVWGIECVKSPLSRLVVHLLLGSVCEGRACASSGDMGWASSFFPLLCKGRLWPGMQMKPGQHLSIWVYLVKENALLPHPDSLRPT